ncbi:S-type pyocin domain-containing protein [Ewingella sp. S1.OA.A_B6]
MPGFNYGGGDGDGTSWSSESGNEPEPGGGNQGNAGNQDSGGNSNAANSAVQKQVSSIQNDPVIRQKLSSLIQAAISINYAAKLRIETIDANGKMGISVEGLNAEQAAKIGLGGIIMGFVDGTNNPVAIGNIDTGHPLASGNTPISENGDSRLVTFNNELAVETGYQANYRSMLERAHQLAQSQSVGAANTEQLRADFIRDRATFRPADLAAINAELDRATVAETGYQANYRSMLERARQLAESQSVGAVNTEQLRADFIRDRAGFRPSDLAAINAELDRATIAEMDYQANYRSMLERARQLAESQSVGAANTEQLRADFIRDRASFRSVDLAAINAELDRATIAEIGYQANYRSMLERARQLAQSQSVRAANTEQLRADFIRDRAGFRPADLAAINAELDRATQLAQAMQARQIATDTLKLMSVQSVRGISVSSSAVGSPLSWAVAGGGGITLGDDIAGMVWGRISAALAELRGIATASLAGPVAVTIMGLLYSKEVGAGSDLVPGRDISTLISGDVLSLPDSATLNHAADTHTSVTIPVRARMVLRTDDILETQLVRTPVAGSVPVVRAILDKDTGYWGYALPMMPGVPAQTILVSPADAPGVNGPLGLTGPVPLPERIVHTGDQGVVSQGVTVTTTPVLGDLDFRDFILIFPTESGLKPLYVMQNSPYGEVTDKGKYSGRPYNPDKAGGAVQDLDWRGVVIDQVGIDQVKLHTGRFGKSDANSVMIDRLDKILKGELQATNIDKRYYTHEIRELERYRVLGVPDGVEDKSVWNDAHTASLEDYKVNERMEPLYTPDAEKAYEEQEMRGNHD